MRERPGPAFALDNADDSLTGTAPLALVASPFAARKPFLSFTALSFLLRRAALFLAVFVAALCSSIAVVMLAPKTYQATARVFIVAANVGRDPSAVSTDLPSLATSSELLARVKQRLNMSVDLMQFKQNVRASVKGRSSILEIKYRDKNRERAVTVANMIADQLVSYYDSISGRGADATISKLDFAIAQIQQRLRVIGDASDRQIKLHPLMQSSKALDDETSRLDDLRTQKTLAIATMASDDAQRVAIEGGVLSQRPAVRYEKLQNDPVYLQLASGIAKDEAELAVDRTRYTDQHPIVKALERKLAVERAMSQAHVNGALSAQDAYSSTEVTSAVERRKAAALVIGDEAKASAISTLIVAADHRLRDSLNFRGANDRIKLQDDASKADYFALRLRRAAAIANRAEALSLGSLVVVDRAVRSDTTVVGLGTTTLGLLMGILAFLVALAAAFAVDMLDRRLLRAEQIERLYGVPLIALINVDL